MLKPNMKKKIHYSFWTERDKKNLISSVPHLTRYQCSICQSSLQEEGTFSIETSQKTEGKGGREHKKPEKRIDH